MKPKRSLSSEASYKKTESKESTVSTESTESAGEKSPKERPIQFNNARWFPSIDCSASKYQILSSLGQGRFSTVHLVKMEGLVMAMKRTDLNSCISDAQAARTEIEVLQRLKPHAHIIRMLGHEQIGCYLTIFMESWSCSLASHLKAISATPSLSHLFPPVISSFSLPKKFTSKASAPKVNTNANHTTMSAIEQLQQIQSALSPSNNNNSSPTPNNTNPNVSPALSAPTPLPGSKLTSDSPSGSSPSAVKSGATTTTATKPLAGTKEKERKLLSVKEIQNVLLCIAKALDYLHSEKIVHRDVKGLNILIDINENFEIQNACLCDLGSVLVVEDEECIYDPLGTSRWMAPEMHKKQYYDYSADIWSFGMTLLEMLSLRLPYYDIIVLDLPPYIVEGKLPRIELPTESYQVFMPFLHECIQASPQMRPKASQAIEKLELLK